MVVMMRNNSSAIIEDDQTSDIWTHTHHRLGLVGVVHFLCVHLTGHWVNFLTKTSVHQVDVGHLWSDHYIRHITLTTLETRRLRGDQIEVFKILNGYENIDRNIFFHDQGREKD